MGNTVWLLVEERNVARKDEADFFGTRKEYRLFSKFEDAVRTMRKVIYSHAFTDNELFDGNGHIREFEKYIEQDSNTDLRSLKVVSEALRSYFASQADYPEISQLEDFDWPDSFWYCTCEKLDGDPNPYLVMNYGDNPFGAEGDYPQIFITSFVMDNPDAPQYFCCIRDDFRIGRNWNDEHYINIILLKTELE